MTHMNDILRAYAIFATITLVLRNLNSFCLAANGRGITSMQNVAIYAGNVSITDRTRV